ncbi:DUF317 domain-containing protein [Streptomyces sp. DG2A-72]|uniref:DUF317 domain-containing protein n=1 Tax=Streptomyces sp. DG2A-72 TaxID=3051386 RepID=UPI00265C4827|nr:DUF317 domain-containing protein [Streptomyces sp. DG2A-72]MDO0936408.1 DUF317 domain-containing protein [Streptomyces sp. DG2A-72]
MTPPAPGFTPFNDHTTPRPAVRHARTTDLRGTAVGSRRPLRPAQRHSAETHTSPDGHCTVRHVPDAETAWQVRHSVHDGFDTHWTATFTQDTPQELIAQFFAHLSTSEPVERSLREIPCLARDMGDALITPVRGAAVNPQVHHAIAQAQHTQARRR